MSDGIEMVYSMWPGKLAAISQERSATSMLNLIGPIDDQFAIFATPEHGETYSLLIYPELKECGAEVTIPAARLENFLEAHLRTSQASGIRDHSDIFVHSLTAGEVLELASVPQVAGYDRMIAHAA